MIARQPKAIGILSTARCSLAVLCFIALLLPSAAAAAEGGGDAASASLEKWFKWINFVIVFFAIAYLFARKTPAWFRGRAEEIRISIREAAQAKESAELRLREAESKLAALESEISQLRKAAEVEAVAERTRILAAAGAESERIHLAAKQEIAAVERAAALGLKRFVARLAIERAEADLRKQVTPQADAALVRSFITGLENRPQ